jgi:outer membrane lipoprotein-sorting protein
MFAVAQNADSIIDKARNRIESDTVSTQSRMVLTDKKGGTTERKINQYSKDDKDGNSRIIIEFLQPKTIAGTRFLTISKKNADDDRWIFLRELGKVRRVASSEGSNSFMGTDLSFDDISSTDREASEDTNTLLREEKLNGNDCYVIQSVAKDASYQYSKAIQWVDKSSNIIWKMEMYDKKGSLLKRFEVKKVEDKQGRLTPMESIMTTIPDNTSTTIYVDKIKYDDPVPEGAFTPKYLETGKP